jgi:hypothetical protein
MVNLLRRIGCPVATVLAPLIVNGGQVGAQGLSNNTQPQALDSNNPVTVVNGIEKPTTLGSGDKQSSSPKIDPLKRAMQIVEERVSSNPTPNTEPIIGSPQAFGESYIKGQEQQDKLSAKLAGLRSRIPGSSPK